jgi:hypothetical protein
VDHRIRPGDDEVEAVLIFCMIGKKHAGQPCLGRRSSSSGSRERENIDPDELLTLREIGAAWLAADAKRIVRAVQEAALQEVTDEEEDAT